MPDRITAADLPPHIREIYKKSLAAGVPPSLILQTANEIERGGEDDDEAGTLHEAWIGPEPGVVPVMGRGFVQDDVYSVLMETTRRRRPRPDREKRVGARAAAVYPDLSTLTVPCLGPGEVFVLAMLDDHNADLLMHRHLSFIHQWIAGRDLDALLLYFRGTATTLQDRARFVLGIVHARADLGQTIRAVTMQPVEHAKVTPRDYRMVFDLTGRVLWQKR